MAIEIEICELEA